MTNIRQWKTGNSFSRHVASQPCLGEQHFRGRPSPHFWDNPPFLPFHSSLCFPLTTKKWPQVQLGALWASWVGLRSEARPRKHFSVIRGKEMCLIATILVLFVGTKTSIWSFWTTGRQFRLYYEKGFIDAVGSHVCVAQALEARHELGVAAAPCAPRSGVHVIKSFRQLGESPTPLSLCRDMLPQIALRLMSLLQEEAQLPQRQRAMRT